METHIQVKSPKTMALILMLGAFIGLFGETALNMALTNVMEDYSISPGIAQWLTTGYLLTLAILVPVSALLMKWFTTRQLVVAGLGLSLIGAVLAALSPSFVILLLGRIVQAMGTGILLPVMLSVVLLIFPIQKRGLVMGLVGLVITAAPALGPTLSGLIISTLGWHYIFWFSAAFYVILMIIGTPKMDNVSEITKPKIDFVSILLSTIGFGGFIYALATMAEVSFSSPQVWLPFVVGIIALVLFCVRQITMDQPMINLGVFKYAMFSLGTLIMFLSILVILSTSILLPMYLKSALGFTALVAGLLLLPGNAVNFAMSPVVGSMFDKIGPRTFNVIGFICVLIANIIFLTTISASTAVWQIIAAFMILFFGLTMTTMPAQTNALNQLPRELYADGSAAMNTLNQVAGAAGTAIAITLFTAGQSGFVMDVPNATEPEVLAAGVKFTFYFITGISVVGLICSLFVKNSAALIEAKQKSKIKVAEPVQKM
ncbi:DHA2 family efflux MFS transporter permease subunit [Oceanobacillus bengalensis]|uniref:DHA2 family efflux MFS transporter permease subunit n=2 Tax=Oceanobacillus bengalensis TaxID=1435466 RepID=A0A494Z7Z7_9BACI|nr:DHA2 family efflux MFS transporter permease subunit [Oceanobacillus bengalensis]RKQ18715.1 DHA2 family efflux MFS transporter permease subunit [Oceanobacillus bengalensis]